MAISSHVVARLIETTLLAVAKPNSEFIRAALGRAQEETRTVRELLRSSGQEVHAPSFELGAGTAFIEVLATMDQRSILGDAIRAAREIQSGVETLHAIAFMARSAQEATQGELADRLGVDRGNFNRRARRLEEAGLVVSQRSGRKVIYALSPLGVDVLNEVRPGWRAIHPETLEVLATEDAARAAASRIAIALQETLAAEQGIVGYRMGAMFGGIGLHDAATDLLGVARIQTRTIYGSPFQARTEQLFTEHRVAAAGA